MQLKHAIEIEYEICNKNKTLVKFEKLNFVILTKESDNLCSSNLQFSFKLGASTSLCTNMVQETIPYYVYNGSNVYGLMLDASKAFDHVNYCKLFRILPEKNVCPLYCTLLLNMYVSKKT